MKVMLFAKNNNLPKLHLKESGNLPEDKKNEFKKHTEEYLKSNDWKVRNIGVKMVGMLGLKEMIPELLKMITDRTPDTLLNRLMGGDFVQVGFIRRNCIRSLMQLKESNSSIKEALYKAIDEDPYWEVRTEAVKGLTQIINHEGLADLENRLIKLLSEKKFEVIVSAITSIGEVSNDIGVLEHLRRFYFHPNQKVRRILKKILCRLYDRGIIKDEGVLKAELSKVFVPINLEN